MLNAFIFALLAFAPQFPIDHERIEEPTDPFGSIDGQADRTQNVVHPDRCSADAFVEDVGEARLDRGPKDGEGSLALERRRGAMDRLKASFDRELGEILADPQVVVDQLVYRDAERVKDPLRDQIQGDDLCVDSPDTPADSEWAHPVVEEVAKQFGPGSAFRARGIPRGQAARPVIPALGLGWVGDRSNRVSRVALVPDTERAR